LDREGEAQTEVLEPPCQSLPLLRAVARLHAQVSDVPVVLSRARFERRASRRQEGKLVTAGWRR